MSKGKLIIVLTTLLFSRFSLADSCTVNDGNCQFSQEKLELMYKMGVKPIATKDQPVRKENGDEEQPPPPPKPFQIPKPEASSQDTEQATQTPQLTPWSSTTGQVVPNTQEKDSTSSSSKTELQPQSQSQPTTQTTTGIQYR